MDLTVRSVIIAPKWDFFVRIVDSLLSLLTICHKIVWSQIEKYYKRTVNLRNTLSPLKAADLLLKETRVLLFRFLLCK